ncbi:MAG: BREX-3 system P-loop-containing protein BrxF [Candidatus Cloacimonetes bacterium]|nr:BREX-3 system P-loop-containing protein BrxF [Candidatus Cloacimonadota bacterium]
MTTILYKLRSSFESIETQYHRLIILVNCEDAGKQDVLSMVNSNPEVKPLNLNLELSSRLLEFSIKQRPLKVAEILEDLIKAMPSPISLDKLDILFDPSLQTDPLALLQSLSRSKTIIAFWSGSLKDNKIYYAEPGYPEYRSYSVQDFVAIDAKPQESF